MSLKSQIRRKITEANLNPHKRLKPLKLEGGLQIRIKLAQDRYIIYISRDGKAPPSETELKTVLNCLPLPAAPENFRAGIIFEIPTMTESPGVKQ